MKLRKNELIEIKKGGLKAVIAKQGELNSFKKTALMNQMKKESSNPKVLKLIRRTQAQLNTIATELKEIK